MAGAAVPPAAAATRVRFDGDAREWTRLWCANLLLSLLTIGLYAPVARRRALRFFRGHTWIAGSPLDWQPAPWRALTGLALLLAAYVVFKAAVQLRDDRLAAALLLAGTVAAPFAWASALRVRLACTSWRGLTPRFQPGWRELYAASWPLFATALVWVAVLTIGTWASALPATVASVGLLLRLEYRYKQLLFARTRVDGLSLRWDARFADLLRVWAGSAAVLLLTLVVVAAPLAWALAVGRQWVPSAQEMGGLAWAVALAIGALTLLLVTLLTAPARAWHEAALFRLLFDGLALGEHACLRCDLQPRAYVRLRTRNVLLSLATLGWYHPVAAVAAYRMKVQSVTLHARGGLASRGEPQADE
jgi:uncharacterized membrane protein YjgN (DUF898 family)